jgi:hypothetical protein
MNQFTRMLSLVATHRLARLEITVQTHSFQNAADGVRRNPDARGNMRAGKTLGTPFADPRDDMLWCRPVEAVRPRGTVPQTGDPLGGITRHPFADGARTDACGSCGGLRRLSARHLHHNRRSTDCVNRAFFWT